MSDSSPINLWQSIPYLDRDATLMGPTRNLAADDAALRADLVVKSGSVLPLIGMPNIQLKTNVRPLTSTTSHGLDPIQQTSEVHVRSSNQNPEASGIGPGSAIWTRSGGYSDAPPIWEQGQAVPFLDGLPQLATPPAISAVAALIVWFLANQNATFKSKALLLGLTAGAASMLYFKHTAAAPATAPSTSP